MFVAFAGSRAQRRRTSRRQRRRPDEWLDERASRFSRFTLRAPTLRQRTGTHVFLFSPSTIPIVFRYLFSARSKHKPPLSVGTRRKKTFSDSIAVASETSRRPEEKGSAVSTCVYSNFYVHALVLVFMSERARPSLVSRALALKDVAIYEPPPVVCVRLYVCARIRFHDRNAAAAAWRVAAVVVRRRRRYYTAGPRALQVPPRTCAQGSSRRAARCRGLAPSSRDGAVAEARPSARRPWTATTGLGRSTKGFSTHMRGRVRCATSGHPPPHPMRCRTLVFITATHIIIFVVHVLFFITNSRVNFCSTRFSWKKRPTPLHRSTCAIRVNHTL